jgi:hypothetical protein
MPSWVLSWLHMNSEEEGGAGLSLSEAVFAIKDQISRLDESHRRNPAEVLKSPASNLIVEQIKDVMHFIPERNPVFKILRSYTTGSESRSGEMRIVDVLPMLEALHAALANEYNNRLKNADEKQRGATREEPRSDFEMHHRPWPRISRETTYHPESQTREQSESNWLRPPPKPR